MALEEARKRKLLTVALLGNDGGEIYRRGLADHPIIVRSDYIPRIQEVQASAYHVSARHTGGAAPWQRLNFTEAPSCPYTRELREWLEWTRRDFLEYDVEADPEARARMRALDGGVRTVPVLVEDGKVIQVGWQGRGCVLGSE